MEVPVRVVQDDPQIPDSESLYRGILPCFIKEGEVVSGAFICRREDDQNISVDRASLSTASETIRRLSKSAGIAQLTAGAARQHTPGVASDPLPDNPAHTLIIYDTRRSRSAWKEVAQSWRCPVNGPSGRRPNRTTSQPPEERFSKVLAV